MTEQKILIEVCAGSVQSAIEAERGGAGRVELCGSLVEGGVTPSAAAVEMACRAARIPIYVMIRPRGGDFLYSGLEFDVMKRDVELAGQYGASGVAFGLLEADGSVDERRAAELARLAREHGMGATFHRAFDMARNHEEALEAVVRVGCERILTSGGEDKAWGGRERIARMARLSAGRVSIMAGSGINPSNARELVDFTGITEIHMSGKRRVAGGMTFRNTKIRMGGLPEIPEYEIDVTDAEAVGKTARSLLRQER